MKKGWREKRLGDVCDFLNRGVSPKYIEQGGIAVLNQRCIRNHSVYFEIAKRHDIDAKKVEKNRLVQAGDVLVNSTGTGTLGRVAQLRTSPLEPTTVDSHITIVRPAPGLFFQEFFGYMLQEIEGELQESGVGSGGQTELNRAVLAEKFLVRFPESLAEQQRIVGILDKAFAGIAAAKTNAEKNLENAKAVFEQQLNSIFAQRSGKWVEKKLGGLARINYGYTASANVALVGPKFLRITDIQNNQVDWNSVPFCQISEKDFFKFKLIDGDIVFARTGATTGKSYLIVEPPESVFASYLIRVQIITDELLPQFLYLFFQTKSYWESIKIGSSGSAQGGFNATKLGSLRVPYPEQLSDQRGIIMKFNNFYSDTRHLFSLYQHKLTALEDLKKSLLNAAFNGEL